VVVLDALPLTAVGKIYKPALRLRATELKLQEVLSAAVPGVTLKVSAKERGAGCVADVLVQARRDPALEQRLRDALGAIAVETIFTFEA
jgi:fatty-acyl-CoA synthase